MKIFSTSFFLDGDEYAGPNIHSDSWMNAQELAESHGLILQVELTKDFEQELQEIMDDLFIPKTDNRVLH